MLPLVLLVNYVALSKSNSPPKRTVKWTWTRGTAKKIITIWSILVVTKEQPLVALSHRYLRVCCTPNALGTNWKTERQFNSVWGRHTLWDPQIHEGNGYHPMVYTNGHKQFWGPLCTTLTGVIQKSFVVSTGIRKHLSQFVAFPTQV